MADIQMPQRPSALTLIPQWAPVVLLAIGGIIWAVRLEAQVAQEAELRSRLERVVDRQATALENAVIKIEQSLRRIEDRLYERDRPAGAPR